MRIVTLHVDLDDHRVAAEAAGEDELNRAIGYAALWGLGYPEAIITLVVMAPTPNTPFVKVTIGAMYKSSNGEMAFFMEADLNKETKRFEFRS